MLRARSLLSRAFVSCSCADLARSVDGSIGSGPQSDPFHEMPCFPFYRPRESAGYSGEKKNEREEGLQDRWVLLLLHAGPTDPVDVNRDSFASWPYLSLAPCAGVTCR